MRFAIPLVGLLWLAAYPLAPSVHAASYNAPAAPSNAATPLSPKSQNADLSPPGKGPEKTPDGGISSVKVLGSLAVVLGVFFLVMWLLRRASPHGFGALPGEVFEVLGRASIANRQQVCLIRCGNKLLLVSVTAAGAETLTEITDPAEVERLADLCRQSRPSVAATTLCQMFRRVENRNG